MQSIDPVALAEPNHQKSAIASGPATPDYLKIQVEHLASLDHVDRLNP